MPEPCTETALARARCRCSRTCRAPRCSTCVLEERLRDPLRAQRVAGHQDDGGDLAGRRRRCGCSRRVGPPEHCTSAGLASTRDFPHLQLAANPHDRTGVRRTRRGLARGAVGRPGHPGAGRLRHPGPARRRRGSTWVAPAGRARRAAGAARRARRPHLVRGASSTRSRRRGSKEEWVGLRGAAAAPRRRRASTEAPLVFHAIGLAEWLFATRFCPRCGGRAGAAGGRPRAGVRRAAASAQFPRTDPAVIMVVTLGRAGLATTSAACSAARRSGRRAATRRWPASASRARRSRTPYAARSPRRSASGSAR